MRNDQKLGSILHGTVDHRQQCHLPLYGKSSLRFIQQIESAVFKLIHSQAEKAFSMRHAVIFRRLDTADPRIFFFLRRYIEEAFRPEEITRSRNNGNGNRLLIYGAGNVILPRFLIVYMRE